MDQDAALFESALLELRYQECLGRQLGQQPEFGRGGGARTAAARPAVLKLTAKKVPSILLQTQESEPAPSSLMWETTKPMQGLPCRQLLLNGQ